MAIDEASPGPKPQPSPLATTPRALAELRYNSLISEQATTSSSDEDDNGQLGRSSERHAEDSDDDDTTARQAIGVSIGRAQTRLTSPRTPAAEKAAALERAGGFFEGAGVPGTVDEDAEEDDDDADASQHRGGYGGQSSLRADGPMSTEARRPASSSGKRGSQQHDVKSKSGGLLSLPFTRRRAATLETLENVLEGWHRTLMSNIPMLRKNSSGNIGEHNSQQEAEREKAGKPRRLNQSNRVRSGSAAAIPQARRPTSPVEIEEAEQTVGDLPDRPQLQSTRTRPGMLRRSTSEGSLVTTRTLSRVSSLGDDSRFEDVREQINSRMKAIKDSWQDSSMRLSSIPKSLNVANFKPDFLRDHSSSLTGWKPQSSREGLLNGRSSISHGGMRPKQPEDPMTIQRYSSAKEMAKDAAAGKHITHPHFHQALENLEGDIVVLGGYRGSILRSAEPPYRQVWVPVKVGLNLRKVNLEVGLEEGSDEKATDTIFPDGMLTHIGPVDIARRLFKRLRSCDNARNGKLRVHDYGYDWRLDPNHLSKRLVEFLRSLPCNQPGVPKEKRGATVIAHSLGGLITRHAVNQQPELFNGVVYAGVPRTCVNILGPLRNGDEVLLSSRVLTAQVNFSIRTSFALLPLDGRCFIDKDTKEEYPVDFFDPQNWIDYRFSPCIARPLPPLAPPDKPSGLAGYMTSMTNALPALPSLPLPGRNKAHDSTARSRSPAANAIKAVTSIGGAAEPDTGGAQQATSDDIIAQGNIASNDIEPTVSNTDDTSVSPRTAVTVPRDVALEYLTRTLASVKRFKQALAFQPSHAASNSYPPIAVIYGKSVPTVYGAKVAGREAIKHADAYDELAFASGDGVVLARAAMVPDGYRPARGGIVCSERGHVTLLGDLEAVGRCLNAVSRARRKGVGNGK